MLDVTDEIFEREVLRADRPVVVEFWAPWCRPCMTVEAFLAGLAEDNGGRVRLARLNIDENPTVASRYDVLSIPTVILFEGGRVVETVVGARSRERYERLWRPSTTAR